MTDDLTRPRKLARQDDVSAFESGADELDHWVRRFAWEDLRANNAITYVSTVGGCVVGYYSICAGGVQLAAVPKDLRKGTRPDPMPVIVLARLAVDTSTAGRGVGAGLLRDALERAAVASESLGAAALLIHARDAAARSFYLHNGDFSPSPIDELQLMVSMKALRSIFPA